MREAFMTKPLVSVILPVYNGENFIREAVESVLAQTYRTIELIVVDDGSRDGTADAVRRYHGQARYFYQPNAGAAAARNAGVQKARADFLAFIDADDLWTADKLSRQMGVLAADDRLDMVFGRVSHFFSPELEQSAREHILCPSGTMPGYHPGCMLIRKQAFLRAGFFDTAYTIGEFIDWYGKATDKGLKNLVLPEVLMMRRIHARNSVTIRRDSQADYVRVLKTALDRRRRTAAYPDPEGTIHS